MTRRRACDNPFAVHRVMEIRYRLSEMEWQRLEQRLAVLDYRAAIVGAHGHGKTTLLEDLGTRLERAGRRVAWLRFSDEARRLARPLPAVDGGTIICCDGAEQLSWWDWRRVDSHSRAAGGLIITTHRPGRLPPVHRCATTPLLLRELVATLGVSVADDRCDRLFAMHRGNLREAIRTLYDDWSEARIA